MLDCEVEIYLSLKVVFYLPAWNRILSMKNYLYRSLAHLKPSQQQQTEQTPPQMTQILDGKLHYINRSFKHNLQIQQIFLDIIKTKRILHSKQIKQYYRLFTENKADSEIFHNNIQQTLKENLQHFLHIKEAGRSLKRLYCRLIEKIMVKVSFYMMNKQKLAFMYKEVNDLMKKCEVLMRRVNYLRDLNPINELVEEIYKENEVMQIKIIEELIDKGFIISIDEFYRINGVDLVDKELYQRVKSDMGEEVDQDSDQQQLQEKLQSIKRFQLNLHKKASFQRMRKEETVKKKEKPKHIHRVGYIQIQNKYRDLLVHLQNLINNDLIDQITEEKDEIASSDSNITEKKEELQVFQVKQQTQMQVENKSQSNQESKHSLKINDESAQNDQAEAQDKVQQSEPKSIKQFNKKQSIQSKQVEASHFDCKSELGKKKFRMESESNSYVSDILNNRGSRAASRQKTSQFFTKSFMNAIRTMEKVNFHDKTNRLAIKRMSQHIMAFHKESDITSNAETHRTSNAANLNNVRCRNNEKRSIIKLINIYKSRKFQEDIHQIQRQFDQYKEKIIRREENGISPHSKLNKPSIFYEDNKKELNQISEEQTISNITNYPKILDIRQSLNDCPSSKTNKYQRNPVFKNLPKDSKLKQNMSAQFIKNIDVLKAKIRLTSNIRPPSFQNARLSHKMQGCLYRMSPVNSPDKMQGVKIQANCLLTSKGIETIDHQRFKSYACEKKDKVKMYKTAVVTPRNELSSRAGRFEVYDRKRRVVLH